jgi:hypothetical protein
VARPRQQVAVHPADADWFKNITNSAAVARLLTPTGPPQPKKTPSYMRTPPTLVSSAGRRPVAVTPRHPHFGGTHSGGFVHWLLGKHGLAGAASKAAQPFIGSGRSISRGQVPSRADIAGMMTFVPGKPQVRGERAHPMYRQNPELRPFISHLRTLTETELMDLLNGVFRNVAYEGPPTPLMLMRDAVIHEHGLRRQRRARLGFPGPGVGGGPR